MHGLRGIFANSQNHGAKETRSQASRQQTVHRPLHASSNFAIWWNSMDAVRQDR